MPYSQFDRHKIKMKPLSMRENKVLIARDRVLPDDAVKILTSDQEKQIKETAERIKRAKENNRPIFLAHGAHTIKNGLAPVLIKLMANGWISHLATNGAGIIHDWEFAFQGESSEDVRGNVKRGEFGNWEETGFYINLAINVGAFEGKGYGESIGAFIENEGLTIPGEEDLLKRITDNPEKAGAAADLLAITRRFELTPGFLKVQHPYKTYSAQRAAYGMNIPYTGHPMFGHDIIYNHPMNTGSAIGRTAERDFLTFAEGISQLDGGVYLSVGSAVMSPMVFEKSMSMAQNLALQEGRSINNHFIQVVDLQESHWDWTKGEPPEDNPDYYLRFNKSFNRMGGAMRYLCADNRDFLLGICLELDGSSLEK
jgi:hypothetical protein